jgi:hypothetical protein
MILRLRYIEIRRVISHRKVNQSAVEKTDLVVVNIALAVD